MRAGNYEPIWDRTGEVPTAFAAEHRKPTQAAKIGKAFYKRLQYRGSVDQHKRFEDQPLPRSLAILEREQPVESIERYAPPDPHAGEGAEVRGEEP